MTVEEVNEVNARNQLKSDREKQRRNIEHGSGPRPHKFCGGKHLFQAQQQGGSVRQLLEAYQESETSDIEFVPIIITNVNVVEVRN